MLLWIKATFQKHLIAHTTFPALLFPDTVKEGGAQTTSVHVGIHFTTPYYVFCLSHKYLSSTGMRFCLHRLRRDLCAREIAVPFSLFLVLLLTLTSTFFNGEEVRHENLPVQVPSIKPQDKPSASQLLYQGADGTLHTNKPALISDLWDCKQAPSLWVGELPYTLNSHKF